MESGDETTTKPTSPPETSRPGRLRVVVWNIARNPQAWPLNIAFVRDRSASMYGHKLHLARGIAARGMSDRAAGGLRGCGQAAMELDEAAVT